MKSQIKLERQKGGPNYIRIDYISTSDDIRDIVLGEYLELFKSSIGFSSRWMRLNIEDTENIKELKRINADISSGNTNRLIKMELHKIPNDKVYKLYPITPDELRLQAADMLAVADEMDSLIKKPN